MALVEPYQHLRPNVPDFQICVRRFVPFQRFFGFEGDNRAATVSSQVTYKTGGFCVIDLAVRKLKERPVGHSTGTRTKPSEPKIFADIKCKIIRQAKTPDGFELSFRTEGSNPMLRWNNPFPPLTPNIDTEVGVKLRLKGDVLQLSGYASGDNFPNLEMFIRDNRKQGHMLLSFRTPHGPTTGPLGLPGDDGRLHLFSSASGIRTANLGTFKNAIQLDDSFRFIGSTHYRP